MTTAIAFVTGVVATAITVSLAFKGGTLGRKGINQVK
jgi:hypothetical protein